MRKSVLIFLGMLSLAGVAATRCGGHCKKYAEKFCQDEKSPTCLQAKEKMKDWSSDKCRMELNEILVDEDSKKIFENELK